MNNNYPWTSVVCNIKMIEIIEKYTKNLSKICTDFIPPDYQSILDQNLSLLKIELEKMPIQTDLRKFTSSLSLSIGLIEYVKTQLEIGLYLNYFTEIKYWVQMLDDLKNNLLEIFSSFHKLQ